MRIVFIDLDGTLLRKASCERFFLWHLFCRGLLRPRQFLAVIWFMLRWFPRYRLDVWKQNKAYLTGVAETRINELAVPFVHASVIPRLCPVVRQRLAEHQQAGHVTVLLTGTLNVIARELGRTLGITRVEAALCNTQNGCFTNERPQQLPWHQEKRLLATRISRECECDLADCYAYADSYDDLPLLEAVGHPVAVRPHWRLRRTARQRGWEVITE
jgi:HAD superfamily hydrolase (TIGR01490 family)